MKKIKAALSWLVGKMDFLDFSLLFGIGLVFYGVYLLSRPWAFVIAGALFVIASYAGHMIGLMNLKAKKGNRR